MGAFLYGLACMGHQVGGGISLRSGFNGTSGGWGMEKGEIVNIAPPTLEKY